MKVIFRIIFLSVLFVTLSGYLSWGGQILMEFKKALWPNSYYLIVDNTGSDRAIEFRGGWEKTGEKTNYYAVMDDENRNYFSSPMFKKIGVKGMLWVPPGKSIKIPFKISDDIIRTTKSVVFKGFSFILTKDNGVANQKDYRDLTIIYDIDTDNFEIEISDAPIEQGGGSHFINNDSFHSMNNVKKHITIDQVETTDSFKAIEIDDFWGGQK